MTRARTRWPAVNFGATATSRLFELPRANHAATSPPTSAGTAFAVFFAGRPFSISVGVDTARSQQLHNQGVEQLIVVERQIFCRRKKLSRLAPKVDRPLALHSNS